MSVTGVEDTPTQRGKHLSGDILGQVACLYRDTAKPEGGRVLYDSTSQFICQMYQA